MSDSDFSRMCPACDGDGSLSAQMAKERWLALGAHGSVRRILRSGSVSDYQTIYYTAGGKELEFKTIGGPCSVCKGKKVIEKIGLLYSTSEITIDEAVIARQVNKETGVIAINGYRFPEHENFPGEIKLALTKEAAKSLVDQLSKLLS